MSKVTYISLSSPVVGRLAKLLTSIISLIEEGRYRVGMIEFEFKGRNPLAAPLSESCKIALVSPFNL